MNRIVVNAATGKVSSVPLTAEEIAAAQAAAAAWEAAEAAKPYALFKTTIISRMTDAEVDAFDAALTGASARQRRMWTDCQMVESGSPFFAVLHTQLAEAFTEDRADAILARE